MVKVTADELARALERFSEETIDAMAVAALKRFAVTCVRKLANYSPIAKKMVPNRGLWKGNWRLTYSGRDTRRQTIPDPDGERTIRNAAAIMEYGPKKLDGWDLVRIGNPGRGAEQIGRRYGVIGFAVEDVIRELGL